MPKKEKQEVVITRAIKLGTLSIEVKMDENENILAAVIKSGSKIVDTLSPKQFRALKEFSEGALGEKAPAPIIIERSYPYWRDYWSRPVYGTTLTNGLPDKTWDDSIKCAGSPNDHFVSTTGYLAMSNQNSGDSPTPDAVVTSWIEDGKGNILDPQA